jgi:hypothetical protein
MAPFERSRYRVDGVCASANDWTNQRSAGAVELSWLRTRCGFCAQDVANHQGAFRLGRTRGPADPAKRRSVGATGEFVHLICSGEAREGVGPNLFTASREGSHCAHEKVAQDVPIATDGSTSIPRSRSSVPAAAKTHMGRVPDGGDELGLRTKLLAPLAPPA